MAAANLEMTRAPLVWAVVEVVVVLLAVLAWPTREEQEEALVLRKATRPASLADKVATEETTAELRASAPSTAEAEEVDIQPSLSMVREARVYSAVVREVAVVVVPLRRLLLLRQPAARLDRLRVEVEVRQEQAVRHRQRELLVPREV